MGRTSHPTPYFIAQGRPVSIGKYIPRLFAGRAGRRKDAFVVKMKDISRGSSADRH
jgi:hypothetical protein